MIYFLRKLITAVSILKLIKKRLNLFIRIVNKIANYNIIKKRVKFSFV